MGVVSSNSEIGLSIDPEVAEEDDENVVPPRELDELPALPLLIGSDSKSNASVALGVANDVVIVDTVGIAVDNSMNVEARRCGARVQML